MLIDKVKLFDKVEIIDQVEQAYGETKRIRKETKIAIPWKYILFIEEVLSNEPITDNICMLRCAEGNIIYVSGDYDTLVEQYERFHKYDNF